MISIKDFLARQLQKTSIFEMAFSRQTFINKIEGITPQLVEDWCLIRYCTLSKRTQTKRHWQNELYGYIDSILDYKLKAGNKKECSEFVIIDEYEFNNTDNVYNSMKRKIKKENIDRNDSNIKQACKDFADFGVHELIDIISMNDTDENFDYIDEYIYEKI